MIYKGWKEFYILKTGQMDVKAEIPHLAASQERSSVSKPGPRGWQTHAASNQILALNGNGESPRTVTFKQTG